jgi:hypothetical protein
VEAVDAAGSSREVEVDLVVYAVAAKAIPTLNRLANINVRTSIKDLRRHSLGIDSRLQSTCNLHRDLTSIPTSMANDTVHQLLPGNSLPLVTKTATSLI